MTGRRLFHFTALHHAREIALSDGISRGGVPVPTADGEHLRGIVPGWQWLTSDDGWRQGWATREIISCDRTECRLTVAIPLLELDRLHRWPAIAPVFGFSDDLAGRFAALGGGSDPSTWYIFNGRIPNDWLIALDLRPGVSQVSAHAHAPAALGAKSRRRDGARP